MRRVLLIILDIAVLVILFQVSIAKGFAASSDCIDPSNNGICVPAGANACSANPNTVVNGSLSCGSGDVCCVPDATQTLKSIAGGGTWVPDPEVQFVGQNAARAGLLLDWTLDKSNYQWVYLPFGANNAAAQNPLLPFWTIIRNIVYAMLVLFVLVTAFVLIATRGRSITVKRFIPRFIAIALLVTFSFYLIQFLYQVGDLIQLFFLKSPTYAGENISQKDLLYVGWNYISFVGLRLSGDAYTESAFMSLLLVKLTALTYYVMFGILTVRKIILWFFIILSPVFPLLLLYKPVRNTGKIWIGEFFRWLMYAPLFAIFLAGLVSLWTSSIPLNFSNYLYKGTDDSNFTKYNYTTNDVKGKSPSELSALNPEYLLERFPTAINIELGAPKQNVSLDNSVNYVETYAEYVVALIMLWIIIILPFILLQIFLDYMNTVSLNESTWMQQIYNKSSSFLKKPPSPSSSPSYPPPPGYPPPGKYQPTGLAKSLPYDAAIAMPLPTKTGEALQIPARVNAELLQLANISVPTMRDIARFETNNLSSSSSSQQQETSRIQQSLERIANPANAVHERLQKESQRGNVLAQNILNAASSSAVSSITGVHSLQEKNISSVQNAIETINHPESARSITERAQATELKQTIMQESEKGNTTANTFISTMNTLNKTELSSISQVLEKLANPSSIKDVSQQKEFTQLRDTLTKESQAGNPVATSILTAAKPVKTKEADIATLTKVREQLKQGSKEGNKLAKDILSKSTDKKTVAAEVQSLLHKLTNEKQKGDMLATKILSLFSEKGVRAESSPSALPLTNRIQTVSIEDYEAVKKMWVDNYQKMDVPQNLEGTNKDRRSWISSDTDTINKTIDLLSSSDQQKISEGMQQVSGILPFLLIGGFSQTEIIAYLKAKQQAGKEVLEQIAGSENEEETTIIEEKKTTSTPQTMQMEEHIAAPFAGTEPIMQSRQQTVFPKIKLSTGDKELLSLSNITLPTMRDIAKFEAAKLTKQQTVPLQLKQTKDSLVTLAQKKPVMLSARLQTAKEEGNGVATAILQAAQLVQPSISLTDKQLQDTQRLLLTITNLSTATDSRERELYTLLHNQLVQENQKANPLATIIYQTADTLTNIDTSELQDLIAKLANPHQEIFQQQPLLQIKNELERQSQIGNPLASSILAITNKTAQTKYEEYTQIRTRLEEEERNGNPLAQKILSLVDHSDTAEKVTAFVQEMIGQRSKNELADAILKTENITAASASPDSHETAAVAKLLRELAEPSLIANPDRRKVITGLHDLLQKEGQNQDPVAISVKKIMQYVNDTGLASLQLILQYIADPSRVQNVHMQEQCKIIRKEIEQEASVKNSFAKTLLQAVETSKQSLVPLSVLKHLLMQIQNEVKKGNYLAIMLLSLRTADMTNKRIVHVLEEILSKKGSGNVLASQLAEVLQQKDINPVPVTPPTTLLPEKNTIQTVNIEDYEAIKHLWQDNYEKAEIPGALDRKEWLGEEISSIDGTIDLLSSDDQASIQQGMKQVNDILPFFLLGGFSLSEAILYLKAKKQAAKAVLDSMEKQATEQESLISAGTSLRKDERKEEKAEET